MPWVSWDRLSLKGPELQTSLWEQDCQHLLGWPLEQTLFRVRDRKGTVLDNEDSGYGKVNETQRQRWCLCAHTHILFPFRGSIGVRRRQALPQEDTSLSTGQSLSHSLHIGSQDFCCLMKTLKGSIRTHHPCSWQCTWSNFLRQDWETRGSLEKGRNHRIAFKC